MTKHSFAKFKKITISNLAIALLVLLVLMFGATAFALGERHGPSVKLANGAQLEASRKTIIQQFLPANSINCSDPSDKTTPTERVYVFFEYLRLNSLDNRAVIRGCNNQDHLLMKASNGQWIQTGVNINLDKRANPAWQKACLIDDITVADNVVRPENNGIDSQNLKECQYMSQHGVDISWNQLIKADN